MPSYNIRDLLESIEKIKDYYVTNSIKIKTVEKEKVYREDIIIQSPYKFRINNLQLVLKIILKLGYMTMALEYEVDGIGLTESVKVAIEYIEAKNNKSTTNITNLTNLISILQSLCKELLNNEVIITSNSITQSDVSYIKLSIPPMHSSSIFYDALGIHINIGSYGIIDHKGKTIYIFSLRIDNNNSSNSSNSSNSMSSSKDSSMSSSKDKVFGIGLGSILPSEIILNEDISSLILCMKNNNILSLPDNKMIKYNNKSDYGFVTNGVLILFDEVVFLKNVLPQTGWFIKVNKKMGKLETVLIIDCSWGLSSKQKSYVDRNM
jgi:hypothetical protein